MPRTSSKAVAIKTGRQGFPIITGCNHIRQPKHRENERTKQRLCSRLESKPMKCGSLPVLHRSPSRACSVSVPSRRCAAPAPAPSSRPQPDTYKSRSISPHHTPILDSRLRSGLHIHNPSSIPDPSTPLIINAIDNVTTQRPTHPNLTRDHHPTPAHSARDGSGVDTGCAAQVGGRSYEQALR